MRALTVVGCLVAVWGCGDRLPRSGEVVKVYDGDTFVIEAKGGIRWRCRLLGLDASPLGGPERAGGLAARAALQELIRGRRVDLAYDSTGPPQDRWCRLLVYATVEGVDVGAELVKGGHVAPWPRYPCDRLGEYEELRPPGVGR